MGVIVPLDTPRWGHAMTDERRPIPTDRQLFVALKRMVRIGFRPKQLAEDPDLAALLQLECIGGPTMPSGDEAVRERVLAVRALLRDLLPEIEALSDEKLQELTAPDPDDRAHLRDAATLIFHLHSLDPGRSGPPWRGTLAGPGSEQQASQLWNNAGRWFERSRHDFLLSTFVALIVERERAYRGDRDAEAAEKPDGAPVPPEGGPNGAASVHQGQDDWSTRDRLAEEQDAPPAEEPTAADTPRRRGRIVWVAAVLAGLASAAVVAGLVTGGGNDKGPGPVVDDPRKTVPSPPERDRVPDDRNGDGVPDSKGKCPDRAARTKSGCPEEVKGLSKFVYTDALRYQGNAETGTTRISGREPAFSDAIWGRLGSHSGLPFDGFTLVPDAGYERVRGWVGIKTGAECPQNKALVSLTDDQGALMWKPGGPMTIRRRVRFDVPIGDASQLKFVNELAQEGDAAASPNTCEDALTEPAWGRVELVRPGG